MSLSHKSSQSPSAELKTPSTATAVRKKKNAVDLDFVKRKPRFPKLISNTKLMRDERSRTNMFYVLFFPLHMQFWRENVPKLGEGQILQLTVLYCVHLAVIASELLYGEGNHNEELFMPVILLGVYAVLMGRVSNIDLTEGGDKRLVSPVTIPMPPSPPPLQQQQVKKKKSEQQQQRLQRQRSASSSDFSDDSSQTSAENDDGTASPRRVNKLSAKSVVSVRRRSSLNQLKDALNINEESNCEEEEEQQVDDSFPTTQPFTPQPQQQEEALEDVCDSVKFVQWSSVTGTAEKVLLTPQQIRNELEEKCEAQPTRAEFYFSLAMWGAVALAVCPIAFRFWWFAVQQPQQDELLFTRVVGSNMRECVTTLCCSVSAYVMSWSLLNHVAGAVDTFERRYLYAKYFSWLTSSRKAQRAGLPYFRLHKVEAIKAWLSLRSKRTELDKETIGPYKSSDVVAHFLFTSAILVVGFVAFRAMQQFSSPNNTASGSGVPSTLQDWLLLVWAVLLSVFVHRITTLATKSQERFSNTSVLLTEELNIHMHLLRKPEKKEELQACNQMLKVAGSLIKELEGSKSKKGGGGNNEAFVLDPMVYSIIRVVFLSALGALSSDLLGFRVRIWKI